MDGSGGAMYRYRHIYIYTTLYDKLRQTSSCHSRRCELCPCVYRRPEMVGPRHLEPFAGRGEVLRAWHGAGPVVSLQISR